MPTTTTISKPAINRVTRREQTAVNRALAELQALDTTHPEWFAMLEDTALDCAPRAQIVDLLANAPTAAARQYVFSKYTTRIALSAVTGQAFI